MDRLPACKDDWAQTISTFSSRGRRQAFLDFAFLKPEALFRRERPLRAPWRTHSTCSTRCAAAHTAARALCASGRRRSSSASTSASHARCSRVFARRSRASRTWRRADCDEQPDGSGGGDAASSDPGTHRRRPCRLRRWRAGHYRAAARCVSRRSLRCGAVCRPVAVARASVRAQGDGTLSRRALRCARAGLVSTNTTDLQSLLKILRLNPAITEEQHAAVLQLAQGTKARVFSRHASPLPP